MEITGAIFDFDGTLFDSMPIWKGVRFKFFDKLGLTLDDEDDKALRGMFLKESLNYVINKYNPKESYDELFDLFFKFIGELYIRHAEPKNDIIEFLEKLKSKGVRMAIATATKEEALSSVLDKFGMKDYFDAIYSIYTVGAHKTEPTVYDKALETIGTDKASTWIFEDALYAVKTAKSNGYNVVGIFDASEPNQKELKEIVDIYINNYSELEI